jgi:AcrR family transcriptional regulator
MGTRERREREKEMRRKAIRKAARKLFLTQGYEATTMPAIAAAAEVAPGTLYLYFPGKQALYVDLLIEGYDLLLGRLQAATAADAPPREQAGALVDAFTEFALDHPDYFDIIFFVLQGARHMVHDLHTRRLLMDRLAAREQACKAIAGEILRRARPEFSPAERRRKIEAAWAMLAGVVLYFVRDDPEVFRLLAAEAREIVVSALFDGPRAQPGRGRSAG